MKLYIVVILICVFSVKSEIKQINIDFNRDDFKFVKTENQFEDDFTYEIIPTSKYAKSGKLGEPAIPYYQVKVLVPKSAIFNSFSFNFKEIELKENITIEPSQKVVPTSKNHTIPDRVEPLENIYNSDSMYPQTKVKYLSTVYLNKYTIFTFIVYPLSYYPNSKKISLNETFSIEISYAQDKNRDNVLRFDNENYRNFVNRCVVNPEDLNNYYSSPSKGYLKANIDDVIYLIITNTALKSSFEELKNWKSLKGLRAEIITVEEIYSNYSGNTNQLKIKNCIKDYHENKGTLFFLLGGDENIIPVQPTYGNVNDGEYVDNTIPADLFYSCFDKQFDWNLDGDDKIGEPDDNADIAPDVQVSRLPTQNPSKVINYTNKVIDYELNPSETDYFNKMLLTGTELWNTWSGRSDADRRSEVLWGYINHYCPDWPGQRYRLYDTNTDFGGSSYDLTNTNLQSKIDDGFHFIHMATHGATGLWAMETGSYFFNSHATTILNSDKQYFIATMACLTNRFDGMQESLSESFINNNGCLGYYGSSRFGWGFSNETDDLGASFEYSALLFTNLFKYYNETHYPMSWGLACALSKNEYWFWDPSPTGRWLQYSINPLGDPGLFIYTEKPGTINVSCQSEVLGYNINSTSLNITTDLPYYAMCCLSKDDEIYDRKQTDSNGNVSFTIPPRISTGVITLVISHLNKKTFIKNINVIPPDELIVTNTDDLNREVKYEANILLKTQGDLEIGNNGIIEFISGEKVKLLPGFKVKSTETNNFKTKIIK